MKRVSALGELPNFREQARMKREERSERTGTGTNVPT